jgi:hypothetical protein
MNEEENRRYIGKEWNIGKMGRERRRTEEYSIRYNSIV